MKLVVFACCLSMQVFAWGQRYIDTAAPWVSAALEESVDELVIEHIDDYIREINKEFRAESQFLRLLKERRDLVKPALDEALLWVDEEEFFNGLAQWQMQLGKLGMTAITSKGYFIEVAPIAFPENRLKFVATPELRDYLKVLYLQTRCRDITDRKNVMPAIQMLVAAEEYILQYPDSEFNDELRSYMDAVIPELTDFHRLLGDRPRWYVGDLNHEDDYETVIRDRQFLVDSMRYSKYSRLVEAILRNPSETLPGNETLFLIIVHYASSEDEARDKVAGYLEDKIDVPHVLQIERLDESVLFACVYRFYPDLDKAKAEIGRIREVVPSAEILKFKWDDGGLVERNYKIKLD